MRHPHTHTRLTIALLTRARRHPLQARRRHPQTLPHDRRASHGAGPVVRGRAPARAGGCERNGFADGVGGAGELVPLRVGAGFYVMGVLAD